MKFKWFRQLAHTLLTPESALMQAGLCLVFNCLLAFLWSRYVIWRIDHLSVYAPFALFVYYLFFSLNKYLHRKLFWRRTFVRVAWLMTSWLFLYALVALVGAIYYMLLLLTTEVAGQKFSTALLVAGGWCAILPGTLLIALMLVSYRENGASSRAGARS